MLEGAIQVVNEDDWFSRKNPNLPFIELEGEWEFGLWQRKRVSGSFQARRVMQQPWTKVHLSKPDGLWITLLHFQIAITALFR